MSGSLLLWLIPAAPAAIGTGCLAAPGGRSVLAATLAGTVATAAIAVAAAVAVFTRHQPLTAAADWLYLDALSAYHLLVMAVVFLLSTAFAVIYFGAEIGQGRFEGALARRFGALWLGAMAAMGLILVSNNLGVMWVGMEATTLLTAFLISLHRSPMSLEAMWKYLIICSVGIAFAFMGTLLVAAAVRTASGDAGGLLWTRLMAPGTRLDPTLMKAAFIFLLVGYGTKAGIAPMHSWLPDAHSQAPAPVSAMFSGFMLNAALYCIARYLPVTDRAVGAAFSRELLVLLGLASIVVAAAFILFQRDAKRLLAYSSVEHLGIITLGFGLGPVGVFAALFHTMNHALCKSLAFFAVGRLGQRYGTHEMHHISGALRADPVWGVGLLGSLLALIGVAPFAVFMSEFQLVRAAIDMEAFRALILFLAGSSVVFVSALGHMTEMTMGSPRGGLPEHRAGFASTALVASGIGLLVLLGLWMPPVLLDALDQATAVITVLP